MKNNSNTLLLTSRNGGIRSYEYNPKRMISIIALGMLILGATIFFTGFHLGTSLEANNQIHEIKNLQAESLLQQQSIEQARINAQDNLDALTLRLGRMQGQVLRLDALGKRLVDVADLDKGEFDFDIDPSVGGQESDTSMADNTVPDFIGMLNELDSAITDREDKLAMLEQVMMYRNVRERVTPSGRAVKKGFISSRYGIRVDPFTGKPDSHKGIDIAGKRGSEILAVGDGVVTFSGNRKGYGNMIEIDHGNGYTTRYAHNQAQLVSIGDTVRKGQAVALMGSTGRSTGPHVHIEVLRDGKQVNPARYLNN